MKNMKTSIAIFITAIVIFYSAISETKIVPLGNGACTGPGLKTTKDGDACDDWPGENGSWWVKCQESDNVCYDVVADGNCDWWLKIYYVTGPFTPTGTTHTYKIFQLPDSSWTDVEIVGP
jgi:hypothetical protein